MNGNDVEICSLYLEVQVLFGESACMCRITSKTTALSSNPLPTEGQRQAMSHVSF